jgi:hypothetical protein
MAPMCFFGFIFRLLEIIFAIEPETGFYVLHSYIPMLFNIYIFLVIAFFMSVLLFTPKEQKPVRGRFNKFTAGDNLIMLLSAVFILSSSMKNFFFNLFAEHKYNSFNDLFSDLSFLTFIFAILASVFIVQFVSSPKAVMKSNIIKILSLAFPLYYVIRLFNVFTDMGLLLSKAYGSFSILFMSFMVLSVINLSEILVGAFTRKYFFAFGFCTVFLAAIRTAEFVLSFIPGNPYNISIDFLEFCTDLFCSLTVLVTIIKLLKKIKSTKTAENSDVDNVDNTDENNPISIE